jgi:hypothetical protein
MREFDFLQRRYLAERTGHALHHSSYGGSFIVPVGGGKTSRIDKAVLAVSFQPTIGKV